MPEKIFYTCRYDRTFKEVFLNPDNKDVLKALLETILKTKIDDIKIAKTELLSGNVNVKDKRVDIIVKTRDKIINIEINCQKNDFFPVRNAAYIFNIYQSHYLVGETYQEDEEILQINLTWGLGSKSIDYDIYKFASQRRKGTYFINNIKIIEINMDYYMKIWYDKNEEEIHKNKYLIMLGLNDKELEKMETNDNIVDKFKESVINVNKDPEFIEYMTEERDRQMKHNTLIKEAKDEGIAEGLAEGLTQGLTQGIAEEKMNTAKNMLKENIDINIISKVTGLTLEEIKKFKY